MDRIARMKMVKAMEYIARQVNDGNVFAGWLSSGVADGDIEFGDLEVGMLNLDEDDAFWYTDDDEFADLMTEFLYTMKQACRSGGLYCDGIISK